MSELASAFLSDSSDVLGVAMSSDGSRGEFWDGFDGFSDNESIINESLPSGDDFPSPHDSKTVEPDSEPSPRSPPPATASKASSSTSPPPPPAGSHYSDTRFYVVWLPEHCSGIWIGRGSSAWYALQSHLPGQKYTPGICRLIKVFGWPEAWNLWWNGGPSKSEVDPFITVVGHGGAL